MKKPLFILSSILLLFIIIVLSYYSNLNIKESIIIDKSYIQEKIRENLPKEVTKQINVNKNFSGKYKKIDIKLKVHDIILNFEDNEVKSTALLTLETKNGIENIMYENYHTVNYGLYDDTVSIYRTSKYREKEKIKIKKMDLTSADFTERYKEDIATPTSKSVVAVAMMIGLGGGGGGNKEDKYVTEEEAESSYFRIIDREVEEISTISIKLLSGYYYVPTRTLRKWFDNRQITSKTTIISESQLKLEFDKKMKKDIKENINKTIIFLSILLLICFYNIFKKEKTSM